MKKRLLSMLLTICMLLTVLPFGAQAYGGSESWTSQPFGWNIASSINTGGAATAFSSESTYNLIADCVDVYLGQLASGVSVTEANVESACSAGTIKKLAIGGFDPSFPSGSPSIATVVSRGLIIVARRGLSFAHSSLCCNDGYGYTCQTAAAGNAGSFDSAITAGTTKVLSVTPDMLSGKFHKGVGTGAWLMLSLGGKAQFNVIYSVWDGSKYVVENTVSLAQSAAIPDYTPADRAGCTFSGWCTDAARTLSWTKPSAMPCADITVYGAFTPVQYSITYDLDGGALADGEANPDHYTVESDAITLVNPTKTGCTFTGWTGTGLTDASSSVVIPSGSTGSRSYTATWAAASYNLTVHYQYEDGTVAAADHTEAVLYQGSYSVASPEITGYTADTSAVSGTMGTEDVEETVVYSPISYTVSYLPGADAATGSMDDQTFTYDAEQPLTANAFENPGYTFAGWVDESGATYTDGQSVKNLTAEDGGTVTLTAQWCQQDDITITYAADAHGSVSPAFETLAPATGEASGSTAAADAGYHFAEWTDGDTQVGQDALFVPEKVGGLNVAAAYTAHFAANDDTVYTVNYYEQGLDGAYALTDTQTLRGTTDTTVTASYADKTGFTFNAARSTLTGTIRGDGSLVLSVCFDRSHYTLTYQVGGSAYGTPQSYFYGASLPAAPTPSMAGYTFSGWDKETPAVMPAEDLIISGTFTCIPIPDTYYTVTWTDGFGKTLARQDVIAGGTAAKIADPTHAPDDGYVYTFTGWDRDVTKPVTSDVTYTAQWATLTRGEHYAYIIGYPDGTVRPSSDITREEVVTVFWRIMTEDTRQTYSTASMGVRRTFTDVSDTDWYYESLMTLVNAGIISGYPDDSFRPEQAITRAEMAKIIARFAALTDDQGASFTDISGNWAESYIKLAAGNGWILGKGDGTFGPDENITRSATITMINRVQGRVSEPTDTIDNSAVSGQTKTFSDNLDTGAWYYNAICEATNSHKYDQSGSSSIHEVWTSLYYMPWEK